MSCYNHSFTLAERLADRNYFYNDPDVWPFMIFWIASPLLMFGTWYISLKNIADHRAMAQKAGMNPFAKLTDTFASFGVRCDATTEVISLPMVYSFTGVLDVFRPELGDLMAFIRIVWFSKAILKILKLFFIRAHGVEFMNQALSQAGPMRPKAPPFCCIFAWPCCAHPITVRDECHPWSLGFHRRGIYAFTVLGPCVALLNIVLKNLAQSTQGQDNRIATMTGISSFYSAWSVWCYRNMAEFTGPIIEKELKKRGDTSFNPGEANFVTLHYLMGHMVELVLSLTLRQHSNGANSWCMPQTTMAIMANGFITCVLEFLLALQAVKLFPHNEGSYPPLDNSSEGRHKGLPLDSAVLLQMNGVPTWRWEIFPSLDQSWPKSKDLTPGKVAAPLTQVMGDVEKTAPGTGADAVKLEVKSDIDSI